MDIQIQSSYRKERGKYINGKEVVVDSHPIAFLDWHQVDWFGEHLILEAIENLVEQGFRLSQESILSEMKLCKQR